MDGPRTIGDIVGERLLSALEAEEEKLDNELHRLDNMEEDEIEKIRRKRFEEMKKTQSLRADWMAKGHGEYREIFDQKVFFEELKGSARAIVHFYRPATRRCEIVDKHMAILARKHIETKFIRINAEKSPFLCERLNIWMLPTIVLVKEGKTDYSIVGFDDLGGGDNFSTEVLEQFIFNKGLFLESYMSNH